MIQSGAIVRWSKRQVLLSLGAFVLAALTGLFLSFVAERHWGRGTALRGVLLGDQVAASLDEAGIRKLLHEQRVALRNVSLTLLLDEEEFAASGAGVGLEIREDETVQAVLAAGRRGGPLTQWGFWLGRLFEPHRVEPVMFVDGDTLEAFMKPRAEKVLPAPQLPSISFDGELVVREGKRGTVVDYKKFQSGLLAVVREGSRKALRVPTRQLDPEISAATFNERREEAKRLLRASIQVLDPEGKKLDALSVKELGAALRSEAQPEKNELTLSFDEKSLRGALEDSLSKIEQRPVDAGFELGPRGQLTITPSEKGLRADMDAFASSLWEASRNPDRQARLSLVVAEPKLSTEAAETLGIKKLVTSFTTRHACCQPRVENIHTAAAELDGVVLRPGETFSLNALLGPRSRANGYRDAPAIVRGEMRKVAGGGISQLATTLFNAVLRGGYEIIQRQPHTIYFSRYPEGHEATVSFPEPDLIFRNDTKAGMVIKTQYSGTFIKVLIYGDDEGRMVTMNKSRRYDVKLPPTEYEADSGMDPEKQKRLRAGQMGWTVLVSRTVQYVSGEKKTEKREVVYKPRPELLRVHPCKIPEGEEGYTGEECPEPPEEELEEVLSDDTGDATVFDDEDEGH